MDVSTLFAYILILFILYKICSFFCYKLRIEKIEGKNVFITGCDTGFGHILAKQLDIQGVKVFAGCLTEKGETELKRQCSNNLVTVRLDVTKSESVRKACDTVQQHIPDGKGLWGLVNNAGIIIQNTVVEALTLEDYRKVLDVNLLGMIDTTVTFLPLIKLAKGRIVNMSSAAGRVAPTFYAPYSISKYGVESFSDALSRERIFQICQEMAKLWTKNYLRQLKDFGTTVHIIEPSSYNTNILHNLVAVTKSTSAGWINLPSEIQDEYGQEYFDRIVKASVKSASYGSKNSQDVVNAYKHALFGLLPQARYMVGKDAFFLQVLVSLPESMSDWILSKMSEVPKPKSCRR